MTESWIILLNAITQQYLDGSFVYDLKDLEVICNGQ